MQSSGCEKPFRKDRRNIAVPCRLRQDWRRLETAISACANFLFRVFADLSEPVMAPAPGSPALTIDVLRVTED
jgi:hypothetical protein